MKPSRAALVLALCALAPGPARAQERVIHDTLSADTPTAVTCGFCATERFGVVFRELPAPRRGIEPEDFPIRLEAVQIAIAAATVAPGPTCTPGETGGTILAPIEIYAGSEVPTGAISSLPADGPWSGEELVWAADAPLALSVAEVGGGGRYALSFNEIIVRDEADAAIVIESGTYIRVVVTLPAAEPATACTGGLDMPGGFPFRDSDGRIAPERGFIYADGAGWLWNEQALIDGDWGVRLSLFRTPPRDAGSPELDAGPGDAGGTTNTDAGRTPRDAMAADAGAEPSGGGCSCRAAPAGTSAWWLMPLAALALALRRRRGAALRGSLCALALTTGCASEIPLGEPCPSGSGCGDGVCTHMAEARDPRCLATTPGPLEAQGTVCLEGCATADVLCAGGEACLPDAAEPSLGSCWLGGPVAIDGACCTLQDCELGTLCVATAAGEAGECRRACVPGPAADCPAGQACAELAYGLGACS